MMHFWAEENLYPAADLMTCSLPFVKVTVQVGTDQNIAIEIFAEFKYTLNEFLDKKIQYVY